MTHHPDRVAVLAFLVVALMLFAPVVAQPGGLVYPPRGDFSDLTIAHWPNIAFAVESLRATGHLPLWRPTIMSGAPFAANPLAGLFYFPHIIFLVLPLAIGFNVLLIAHVWLTGWGAYALLRAWQVERPAAFVGALAWMATPKLFAHLGAGHVGMVEAVAWLPLAVLAAHRMVGNQRAMDAVWLGAVWAVQFLVDPRISFYTIALTASYLLVEAVFTTRTPRRQVLLSLCLCVLVATLSFAVLSAVLWVPFVEFIVQSNRGALTLAEAGEWSLPLHQLVGLLIADWGGFHEWMVYVGVLPLVLAIAGCTRSVQDAGRRGRNLLAACFLPLVLIVALLFALGTNGPLFPILFRIVPGLSLLRVPPRAWFVVAFATACLCAFGVEAMMREVNKPRGWVTLTGVALAAFALLFGLGGFLILQGNPQAVSARAAMLHLALVVPATMAVVLLRAHGRIGARGFAVASAVVAVATLLPVDWSLYRVVPEAQAFSEHADVAAWLSAQRTQMGMFRVYSPSYSLPQHVAQRAGLELADGVDPMQLDCYASWMKTVTGASARGYSVTIPPFPPGTDVRTALRDVTPDARLLGWLNVRYVAAEFPMKVEGLVERARFGPTFVYENQWAMPRAFVGETAARVIANTPDRIVVEADGPGTLTLIQVYYPGWRARVDGHMTPMGVLPIGGMSSLLFELLVHLKLEAGHHVVEFVFDPWTVKVGVLVSGVGWVSLVVGRLVLRLSSFVLRQKGQSWNPVDR